MDLENATIIKLEELIDEVNVDLEKRSEELKDKIVSQLKDDIKKIIEEVKERVEKFLEKRNVLSDCKSQEKEKRSEFSKCENLNAKLLKRV